MAKVEVSFLDHIQVSIRFYVSLIKYKVGNLFDPPLKRKGGGWTINGWKEAPSHKLKDSLIIIDITQFEVQHGCIGQNLRMKVRKARCLKRLQK